MVVVICEGTRIINAEEMGRAIGLALKEKGFKKLQQAAHAMDISVGYLANVISAKATTTPVWLSLRLEMVGIECQIERVWK